MSARDDTADSSCTSAVRQFDRWQGATRHLGSEVRWRPRSMTDTAGDFRIAGLFALLEVERPKLLVWSGHRGPCHRIPPENRTAPDSLSARTTCPLPILVLCYAADRFIVT